MFHLYATRTAPLWKQAANSELFASTLAQFKPFSAFRESKARNKFLDTLRTSMSLQSEGLQYSVYRNVLIASQSYQRGQQPMYRSLYKYMPKLVQEQCARSFSYDPLPPGIEPGYELSSSYWDGVAIAPAAGQMLVDDPVQEQALAELQVRQLPPRVALIY